MTIQIKNVINSYAYDKVVSLLEKGDTTKWSVNDWIKFIDENGNWEI